jgi:hypothetical protein
MRRTGAAGVILALIVATSSTATANKARSRIEELFVWRVSDTLSLSPDVEGKFSSEFKRLSEQKAQLSNELEKLVEDLEKSRDPKSTETLLKQYKEKLKAHSRIQIDEMESFEKLFGKQKFAQYLVLKRELTQKLKDFVSNPSKSESSSAKKLQEPKIIQDESK